MVWEGRPMRRILVACAVALLSAMSVGTIGAQRAEASLMGNTVGAQFLQPNTSTILIDAGPSIVSGARWCCRTPTPGRPAAG